MEYYAPHLRHHARTLRKNMTKQERKLWYDFLKTPPVTVKRQEPIGRYIADFYIPSAKIAVERDGSQHFEDKGLAYDGERDCFFAARAVLVLRYPNNDVTQNFAGVCENILLHLEQRTRETRETETSHG